jgi:chromosome segregation ATPase
MFELQKASVAQSSEDGAHVGQTPKATSGQDNLIKSLNAEMLDLQKEVLKLETQLEHQAAELEKAKQQSGGAPEELQRLRAQNEQLELSLYQLKSELDRALARETKAKAVMKELRSELFEVQQAYATATGGASE